MAATTRGVAGGRIGATADAESYAPHGDQAMSETLELLRDKVWAARIAANADDTTYAERLAEFEAANARLVESRKRAHQHVAEAESALRAAAEAHYRVTGEKKPVDGVAIREAVSLEYAAADAVAWAKTAMPQLVHEVLDVKAFDSLPCHNFKTTTCFTSIEFNVKRVSCPSIFR